MPFDDALRPIFKIIQGVFRKPRWECARADDQWASRHILSSIIEAICETDVVVADLTTANANVYYEVGVAQAIGKDVILIAQDIEEVRSNLRGFNVHCYGIDRTRNTRLTKDLRAIACKVESSLLPFNLEDDITRTRRIIEEMEFLKEKVKSRRTPVTIRIHAGFSSLCNLDMNREEDADRREHGQLLVQERELLKELLRLGAKLKAILSPPILPHGNETRMRDRLDMLIDFAEHDDKCMANCSMALAADRGTNLLVFDNELMFEGYKTEVGSGFGFTCVSRHRDWIEKRIKVFDLLFDSACKYTLSQHGDPHAVAAQPPLQAAFLKGLRDTRTAWSSGRGTQQR
jgi:hypothetical protein